MRNSYNILVGKHEGKRPVRRPRNRWKIGWKGVEWIHLAKDRDQWRTFVNMAMNVERRGVSRLAEWLLTSQECYLV
jgi:hypothetical protein